MLVIFFFFVVVVFRFSLSWGFQKGIVICYIGAIHSFVTPLALQFGKNGKFLRLICGGCTVACGVVGLITLWTSPAR